jgi:glucose dehydrogenase
MRTESAWAALKGCATRNFATCSKAGAAAMIVVGIGMAAVTVDGQAPALDPALLAKPPIDAWPTYNGDYSGRRYSTLKQINASNVKNLTLAWVFRLNTSRAGALVAGEGPDTPPPTAPPTVKSTPLMLNGILYFSAPDHVWAVDARTGREVWHFVWKTRGGDHIGNRGVGIYGNWLYFLTPDNYFVSLDLATGKERWHHEIANMKREYFSTTAPMVIGRHVIMASAVTCSTSRATSSRAIRRTATWSGAGTRRRKPENRTPRRGRTSTRCRTAAACPGCRVPTTLS